MNLHDLIRKYADGGLIEATPEVGSMYAQQAQPQTPQRPIEQERYPTMPPEGPVERPIIDPYLGPGSDFYNARQIQPLLTYGQWLDTKRIPPMPPMPTMPMPMPTEPMTFEKWVANRRPQI